MFVQHLSYIPMLLDAENPANDYPEEEDGGGYSSQEHCGKASFRLSKR